MKLFQKGRLYFIWTLFRANKENAVLRGGNK